MINGIVSGRWAGVDSVWKQEKLEASLPLWAVQGKMLEKAAESLASSTRFVGQFFAIKKLRVAETITRMPFYF